MALQMPTRIRAWTALQMPTRIRAYAPLGWGSLTREPLLVCF